MSTSVGSVISFMKRTESSPCLREVLPDDKVSMTIDTISLGPDSTVAADGTEGHMMSGKYVKSATQAYDTAILMVPGCVGTPQVLNMALTETE